VSAVEVLSYLRRVHVGSPRVVAVGILPGLLGALGVVFAGAELLDHTRKPGVALSCSG
jgi:uncharacterized membrane protein